MPSLLRMTLLAVITLAFVGGALLPGDIREAVSKSLSLGNIAGYAHVFFCALIALLLGWIGRSPLSVFVMVMTLGGLIELMQLWIPYRSTSWWDVVDNALGASLGLLVLWLGKRCLSRGNDG